MGEFKMPSLGADMEEGTLLLWKVRPGDTVHRGDIIAEVATEAKQFVEAADLDPNASRHLEQGQAAHPMTVPLVDLF